MQYFKKPTWRAFGALALLTALAAPAAADQALAGAKACLACHSATTKMVGPPFRDIAQRYKSTPGAADLLAGRIVKGSNGQWGPMPMPPQGHVTNVEAQQLARWILGTS